jgi:hypothetical protein
MAGNPNGKPRGIAAVLLALLALGCGDGGETTRPAPRPVSGPPLCSRLQPRVTGHVATPAATELSGLVLSRAHRGVLWTHNDSGDRARVFAVATDGRLLGEVAVTGAESFDWEDIAVGPEPGGHDALYVGDIGDNLAQRSDITVYRMQEPAVGSGTATAERLTLRYPDRAHDAEALLVDPSSGALVIVTKDLSGRARLYVAEDPSPDAVTTMRSAGSVSLGNALPVTAGDVSADGGTIALRTYDRAFVWSRRRGESLVAAMRRRPCTPGADLLSEGQGEALALTANGRAFYTVPEGGRPAVRRYAAAASSRRSRRRSSSSERASMRTKTATSTITNVSDCSTIMIAPPTFWSSTGDRPQIRGTCS